MRRLPEQLIGTIPPMDTRLAYTNKAEMYARYRWDYAAEAIEFIIQTAGLTGDSAVVDLGAGTGKLTAHFAGRVAKLAAVEPNRAMLVYAEEALQNFPGCTCIEAPAEATGLPDSFADLITAAHAVHWFDAGPALREIRRILKPGGWIAILRNNDMDHELRRAVGAVSTAENGVRQVHQAPSNNVPLDFFYAGEPTETHKFPFVFRQNWQGFLGAAISASFNPNPGDPAFPAFEQAMRGVFERFAVDIDGEKWLENRVETEVVIGKMGIIN